MENNALKNGGHVDLPLRYVVVSLDHDFVPR
jgi:hypothetical protein